METRLFVSLILFTALLTGSACSSIKTEELDLMADGAPLRGVITYDSDISGERPAVIIFHEWSGHNDYARSRARNLAELGYTAIAVDMEGDVKETHHVYSGIKTIDENTGAFRKSRARFVAAEQALRAHANADASRISVIGYCFGGAVALNMARQGSNYKVVVSYHGDLRPAVKVKKDAITARLYVFHGADDKLVSPDELANFKKEMTAANARMVMIEFKGAAHGFTNPHADEYAQNFNLPVAYNKVAADQSWDEMSKYLQGRR